MKHTIFLKKDSVRTSQTKTKYSVNLRTRELPLASSSTEDASLRTVTVTTNSA
jgi:hypothetical protein